MTTKYSDTSVSNQVFPELPKNANNSQQDSYQVPVDPAIVRVENLPSSTSKQPEAHSTSRANSSSTQITTNHSSSLIQPMSIEIQAHQNLPNNSQQPSNQPSTHPATISQFSSINTNLLQPTSLQQSTSNSNYSSNNNLNQAMTLSISQTTDLDLAGQEQMNFNYEETETSKLFQDIFDLIHTVIPENDIAEWIFLKIKN